MQIKWIRQRCSIFAVKKIENMPAENFDPNMPGLQGNNIFGLPFKEEDAELIIIPVPWEVTISYRGGTGRGPEQIFEASAQIDLYDADYPQNWKKGYYMLPIDKTIQNKSDYLRSCAELVIGSIIEGDDPDNNEQLKSKLDEINEGGDYLAEWLYATADNYLKQGKKVAVIGGEHSCPLGYIKALAKYHPEFGVLQIDAHADLRKAYEGFTYSHASIMYNILEEVPEVNKLVQVGIRDYCDEENDYIVKHPKRIKTFFDKDIKEAMYNGKNWNQIVHDIIDTLPKFIYVSFDIDGLDPKLCPNTGTPVPGGFELEQIFYLFKKIEQAGKTIIGFDINEVSCGSHAEDCIDPIVGARALYKLCNILVNKS